MALESLPKIAPALFSAEQDLIQIYNKKSDTLGVINASLIGGNTPPSGVSGAIQFSNGSAFASDASNLFWDNTNKRLGIGTNAPTQVLDIVTTTQIPLKLSNNQTFVRTLYSNNSASGTFDFINNYFSFGGNNLVVGSSSNLNARLGVVGSGSTSATTSLLVQNSAGATALTINDGLVATFANNVNAANFIGNIRSDSYLTADGGFFALRTSSTGNSRLPQSVAIGTSSEPNASAALDIVSTTKGVLFPRMSTAQKNAIATPAAGLVVFDTDLNKLCVRGASAWETITSV